MADEYRLETEVDTMPRQSISTPSVCGVIARPLFFITALIGTALTSVALFTPGWIHRKFLNADHSNFGLIVDSYGDWWNDQQGWHKMVTVLLILALAIEIIVLTWTLFSFAPTCLPSLFIPVPFFTATAAILLVTCVVFFGANTPDEYESRPSSPATVINANTYPIRNEIQSSLLDSVGYSFWIAVCAMAVMIVATFFACVTAMVSHTF